MRAKPRENVANDADGGVSSESEEEGAVPNAVAIERAFANTVVSRRVDVSEKRVALRARDDHGDATRESLDTRPSSDARRCVARRCVARRRARDRVDDDSFITVWFIK